MKLKYLFFIGILLSVFPSSVYSQEKSLLPKQKSVITGPEDEITRIKERGYIRCGTDLSVKSYSYLDKYGHWQGIDPTWCKIFSIALFGQPYRYKLVNVRDYHAESALEEQKIDVMLGNSTSTVQNEIKGKMEAATPLYYDRISFLARIKGQPSSMKDLNGLTICVTKQFPDWDFLQQYLHRYNLNFNIVPFQFFEQAKAAFLTKRCYLLVGMETILTSITGAEADNLRLLPEEIYVRPIYAMVSKKSPNLKRALKWIVNTLVLMEENGITSDTILTRNGENDILIRSLLGTDPKAWKTMGLHPNWVKETLKLYGNYGEIYEKILGKESPLNLDRNRSSWVKKHGLSKLQEFL